MVDANSRNVIDIELHGDRLTYTSGETIKGVIHVTQQDNFDNINALIICLNGYESLQITKEHKSMSDKKKTYF